jgi:hypothetical protein
MGAVAPEHHARSALDWAGTDQFGRSAMTLTKVHSCLEASPRVVRRSRAQQAARVICNALEIKRKNSDGLIPGVG